MSARLFRPGFALLAALALPLAACGGGEDADTTTVVESTESADAPAMPTDPVGGDVTVDGTIAAAGTDLTALPVADATANIDGWIAKLEGAEFEQADGIVAGLRELKTQLATMPLDGSAIGATLADLGDETTAAAAGASSSSQDGLRTLGRTLSTAGERLGGTSM